MDILIDKFEYKNKPNSKDIARIKVGALNNIENMDDEVLADEIGNHGRAFFLSFLQGGCRRENFEYTSLFALDFDNKNADIDFEDILSIANKYNIPILFAYETYSSTKEVQKFRVVFKHEFPIDNVNVAEIIIGMLMKIFPSADPACKDVSRLFFGGKKLLHCNPGVHFHLVYNLLLPFYDQLAKNNNLKREIYSFSKKYNIGIINNRLCIYTKQQLSDFDDFLPNDISNNILNGKKSPDLTFETGDIIIYTKDHVRPCCEETTKGSRKIRRNLKTTNGCALLNDFRDGNILSHDQRFMILTNVAKIENGYNYFMDIMRQYYPEDSVLKWDGYKYVKSYLPQSCSPETCQYYYDCHKGKYKNIIGLINNENTIIVDSDNKEYGTIEEAENNLINNINMAMRSAVDGIHLIKAQTGLGKTEQYIRYIQKHPEKKFIIAVPTNAIKKEVNTRMQSVGINTFMTSSVSNNTLIPAYYQDEIQRYHNMGIHDATKRVIGPYIREISIVAGEEAIPECKRILEGIDLYSDEQVIVTTHAYYLTMKKSFIEKFNVIIDEDILYLTIANNNKTISYNTLASLKKLNYANFKRLVKLIESAKEDEYNKVNYSNIGNPISIEKMKKYGIEENVNDLRFIKSFIKDSKSKKIYYFAPPELPSVKTIILSATFNENVYAKYFNRSVVTYPEVNARYKGELIQYTYYSLGRSNLADKKTKLMEFVKKELGFEDPERIISFKTSDIGESELHYGNAIGVNSYKGKDILIIGTPFKNELCYKLLTAAIGEKIRRKDTCKRRKVTYKGYSFIIMTYSNQLLQDIQLYSLESELEQCVGRARLLREKSRVYLLSCFPVEQAKLVTNDYLACL